MTYLVECMIFSHVAALSEVFHVNTLNHKCSDARVLHKVAQGLINHRGLVFGHVRQNRNIRNAAYSGRLSQVLDWLGRVEGRMLTFTL